MILFENVNKKYRGTQRPALDNINFEIKRGEFVFIVGASGSGKSSCLRLILREEQPTGGRIHVLGQDLGKISTRKVPYFRRNLGVVFQDFRLLTNKTVYDNVAFSLQVIGKSRGFIQEAVPDTLKMVGLEGKEKRYPHELSGGEQQRVAIARAIVNKPSVLLADEPTGNLDPATSLGIMQLLRAINAAGTTIVMATHEAVFVDIMQQRVIEISQGVVVRDEQRGGYGETASIPMVDLSQAGVRTMRTSDEFVRQTLSAQPPVMTPVAERAEVPPVPPTHAASNEAAEPAAPAQPTEVSPVLQRQTAPEPAAGAPETDRVAPNTDAPLTAAESPAAPAASTVTEQPVATAAASTATAAAMVSAPEVAAGAPVADPLSHQSHGQAADTQVQPQRDIPEFLKPAEAPEAAEAVAAVPSEEDFDRTVTAEEFARTVTDTAETLADERDPVRLAQQGGWAKRLGLSAADNDDQTDVGPVR